jgi:hypothetical protein
MRIELRQMFGRWLSRSHHMPPMVDPDLVVDAVGVLDLCEHYRLEYAGGMAEIAKDWDESEQRIADAGPVFDELSSKGWVCFDGGRWIMPRTPPGTSPHITYPSPSTKEFLTGLGNIRLVARTDTPPPETKVFAAKVLAEKWLDRRIPVKDPAWLAGRIWERLCPKQLPHAVEDNASALDAAIPLPNETDEPSALMDAEADAIDEAFLEWATWCDVLGSFGSWDTDWRPIEMRYCREAAHRALQRQRLWGVWNADAVNYAETLQGTFAIPQDRLRYSRTPRTAPPRILVSCVDWLKWPEVEHLMMGRFGASTISFALGLLCSELEKTEIGPGITDAANKVITFAVDRPMALKQFLFRVDAAPALLVDMLMHRRAGCLAARLVIEWHAKSGRPSDRNVSREAQTKAFAVQDALSLLAYYLEEGALDLEECASLITWCYADSVGSMRAVADSRRPVGRQLLGAVARKKPEDQHAVLKHLVDQAAYEDNVPRARFAAVLDGLEKLSSAQGVEGFPVVALYSKFARDMHLDWTDASSLPAELAGRLVATAFAQAASERDGLLIPFDSATLLRLAAEDERRSLRSSIAETLRKHVRLLARAVAGWRDAAVPTELCDALQTLISRSVIEHAEKGRVGALTDSYNPRRFFGNEDGSPAEDLASSWRRLDGGRQEVMLRTFAQSDDPVLLAELCKHLPAAAKSAIRARLQQLKPGEASAIWTWPELQHRIESLLTAGEYGLAREHLDDVHQELHRAPPQFRLGLFGVGLQLLLKEKNWTALDILVVPPEMDAATTRQAQDQLDFYRATSQLLRPNGDLAGARLVLQSLAARPGAASSYGENVFAVAIQQLLGPTLRPLTAADKKTGEGLLAEINAAVSMTETLPSSSLLANRALLLLALQRPEDALKSVAARREEKRSPDLEVMVVLAKLEMGFQGEAMALLDAAISEFGNDDQLVALKNDLQAGDVLPSVASASVDLDPISSIRAALQQLTELPPSQVGEVLGPIGRGVRGYLVRQVSRAVAALQHMAAMLRDRKNPENEARFENDLNSAVREVLGASLGMVKWDVADQSLGGATTNGNPGERDAVIRVSGQEISIYEALVCSTLDRTYIREHFEKLLSYGVCDIYFHVTYSYAKQLEPLLSYIRQMLEYEVPPGLTYLRCETLEPPDYETSGYIAIYRADHREVAVVFLIANLRA